MIAVLAQAASTTGADGDYLFWGLVLFGVALVLLALELFVPSGGLLGILCGAAAIGSIIAFFRYDTTFGIVAACAYLVLGPVIIVFFFKLWLNSPLARTMILGADREISEEEDSDDDSRAASERARRLRLAELQQLVGAEGVALTALRPVGFVRINGQRLDAMAEGGIIEAGTPIVVTDVYDNQVKVRPRDRA